ncbi:hypothetical protein [Roseobacter sinensis]|uniref:Uncharacterized protein n=1 Tax=Roseobacter sinensis TaxID=2931391 RepID=A0ABT3B8P1_9RHOB|nr:hypothetical protein [Roseobacter sp. WL0113]MCV3269941.1 hypothetical protein [Roseobacter sp. WL0113]
MIARIRKTLRHTAQRFALGSFGALMGLAGLGFLSAAALMLLLTMTDPITACAIMGGSFLGIGLLMMAIAGTSNREESSQSRPQTDAQTQDMPPLAAAFLQGVAQGMAQQQRRH